ncbi:winged helix-turn-helix transcriptional regulator [Embleya sp. AB8]|uniref:winged helix-turn-helix transcriptional regulator n=1 Tax=Embleya sp. AB8 TaxID=3156304 RepID=UPI003C7727A8
MVAISSSSNSSSNASSAADSASASPGRPARAPVGRPCSVAATLAVVGEKWALLAVRELAFGNNRFDAIARNTGAPRDILTTRLRAMEVAGILERRQYQDRPPRFEYHLTEQGRDLAPVIQTLASWGDRWLADEPPVEFRHGDHELDAAMMCRRCGEEVGPGEVQVHVHAEGWDVAGPVG